MDKEQFTQYLNDKIDKQNANGSKGLQTAVDEAISSYNQVSSEPITEDQAIFFRILSSEISRHSVAMATAVTAELLNDYNNGR